MSNKIDPIPFIESVLETMFTGNCYDNPANRALGYISALRDFDIITGEQWFALIGYMNKLLAKWKEMKDGTQ